MHRQTTLSVLLSLSLSFTPCSTLPFSLRQIFQHEKRVAATYSVVPVDGSSSTATAPPLSTVTQTVATTDYVTESGSQATILQTITMTSESGPSATLASNNTLVTVEATSTSITVISEITAAPSTTTYYDNGMWHTFYPVVITSAPNWESQLASSSIAAAAATASATADDIQPSEESWISEAISADNSTLSKRHAAPLQANGPSWTANHWTKRMAAAQEEEQTAKAMLQKRAEEDAERERALIAKALEEHAAEEVVHSDRHSPKLKWIRSSLSHLVGETAQPRRRIERRNDALTPRNENHEARNQPFGFIATRDAAPRPYRK